MQGFYLLDLIKKLQPNDADLIDYLKYELDQRIYYYGQQFKSPKERSVRYRPNPGRNLKQILIQVIGTLRSQVTRFEGAPGRKRIMSNSYHSLNDELDKIGYKVFSPIWAPGLQPIPVTKNARCLYNKIKKTFDEAPFKELISQPFLEVIRTFKREMKTIYTSTGIDALFVPFDLPFFEILTIDTFKEIKKPSFIFLHGLPGRYNLIDDNLSDYLIVWGEKIKQYYIDTGFSRNKIIVSGHPKYQRLENTSFRFDFQDVLVITKPMSGAQYRDEVRVQDRGRMIYYLYTIQSVLKSIGVKSVRFRPHPSESGDWNLKFIDPSFFHLDQENLDDSLSKSSLVIGPSSTMFIEALVRGVNYLIYEPTINNRTMSTAPVVPPFDGSDARIPVANDDGELLSILRNKEAVDKTVLPDYLHTPFDLTRVKSLI